MVMMDTWLSELTQGQLDVAMLLLKHT